MTCGAGRWRGPHCSAWRSACSWSRHQWSGELIIAQAAAPHRAAGFAVTSMNDVAGEAGITKMILYQHFASKGRVLRGGPGGDETPGSPRRSE
ncbi:MAG: TetR/AcrR family transcriptional regulator [Egibacteraceae bacterium]